MDPMVGRFLLFVPVIAGCVVLAIGINTAIFRIGDAVSDWWKFRKVRKQAKAER